MHKVLLIGLGYHARRIHVPILKELAPDVELSCVVDIVQEKNLITKYLEDQGLHPETCFLSDSQRSNGKVWMNILNGLIRKHGIDAVLIATEPLSHYEYALWALENNLHILLDKPISTAEKIANSLAVAKRNLREYEDIERKYKKVLETKNVVFTILAQRRFHAAYDVARDAIQQVFSETNCPVRVCKYFCVNGC